MKTEFDYSKLNIMDLKYKYSKEQQISKYFKVKLH